MTAYDDQVLSDSPVGYWKMQEASGLPQDSSGNANHMTDFTGATQPNYQQAGPFNLGYSIEYPGGRRHHRTAVSTATSNFSLEFWGLIVSTINSQTMVGNNNGGTNGWAMLANSNRKGQAIAQGVALLAETSVAAFPVSTWTHFVLVKASGAGGIWTYYINGVVDTANAGTTSVTTPSGATTKLGNPDGTMQLKLSHVAIYNSALSSDRVIAHYEEAAGQVPYVSITVH